MTRVPSSGERVEPVTPPRGVGDRNPEPDDLSNAEIAEEEARTSLTFEQELAQTRRRQEQSSDPRERPGCK